MGRIPFPEDVMEMELISQEILAERVAHRELCHDCAFCKVAGKTTGTSSDEAEWQGVGYCPEIDLFLGPDVHPSDFACYSWTE